MRRVQLTLVRHILLHSSMALLHLTSLFRCYSCQKRLQVDDLAWCIMREISKMCYNPIEDDVTRAKNQLKAAILFSQDNLSGM